MNELTIEIALLALAAVFLFPPADRVLPATPAVGIGSSWRSGRPERRLNEGFTFISEIGGPVQIRFTQWFVQIGTVVVLGGAFVLSTKKNA